MINCSQSLGRVHEVKAGSKDTMCTFQAPESSDRPDLASASTATDRDASAALAFALLRLPQKWPKLASINVASSLGAEVSSTSRLASSP